MRIRPATPHDANAITGIWNPVIRDTVSTFTSIEKTVADIHHMIHDRAALNHGFYIAEDTRGILGFATYGPFRSGPGYAFTMEHSIFLAPSAMRQGTGKALMETLEAHARDAGLRSLIAGLSAENLAGIGFHAQLSYIKVADIKQAGFKFGRWHDLVLMQKLLLK